MRARRVLLMVATRKGVWLFHGDAARKTWRADGPHFLGHVISHVVLDPRDGRTLLAAAKTGHLGPTVFRSTDLGRTWKEAAQPPAFAKAADGEKGRSVDHTFWLTPAHANEPGVWYAGTSPQGLFRSGDGGVTWAPFSTINDDPTYREWMGTVQDGTPDGPKLHSIIVDPRDPRHLYLGMSGGGVHESLDGGRTWRTLIKGMDVVEGFGFDASKPTFHDPHCLRMCPSNPDRIYQQNHCGHLSARPPIRHLGAHRQDDAEKSRGHRLPARRAPARRRHRLGVSDGRNPGVAAHEPRRQARGVRARATAARPGSVLMRACPAKQAWWTVKRQAMTGDAADPVGLYFGTTSGELWMSRDEGRRWACIARHLPEIYAVEAAELG